MGEFKVSSLSLEPLVTGSTKTQAFFSNSKKRRALLKKRKLKVVKKKKSSATQDRAQPTEILKKLRNSRCPHSQTSRRYK